MNIAQTGYVITDYGDIFRRLIHNLWQKLSRTWQRLVQQWYVQQKQDRQHEQQGQAGFGHIMTFAMALSGKEKGMAPSASATIPMEDMNARAEFYLDEYGNSMLRLAYSYLHNTFDAEEIVQDAIMKMLSVTTQFENRAHEKSYLMTIVANLSKNRIKYNELRSTDELSEELIGEEREDLTFVWEAVKKLPEKYREVVHLFYHEGYQTAEIAKILHANEATVRSNLSRARKELKSILKEEYDFE